MVVWTVRCLAAGVTVAVSLVGAGAGVATGVSAAVPAGAVAPAAAMSRAAPLRVLPAGVCESDRPVRMSGGEGVAHGPAFGEWTVRMDSRDVSYGQVDGIGPREIGIVVACEIRGGGNASWAPAYLLRATPTVPAFVQEVAIPRDALVAAYPTASGGIHWYDSLSISLSPGGAAVRFSYHRSGDPGCCGSGRAVARFAWQGSRLVFRGCR